MKPLILGLDRVLTGLCLYVACAMLAIISCLGMWQVVSRFVFEQPSTWTEEAMRRLLIWMVTLGIVAAFRQGALVSVDLMLRTSRGAWRQVVRSIITGVNLAFLSVVAWQGFQLIDRVRFQTFASMELDGKTGNADGIRCDEDGNVWASAGWVGDGYDGVHVFAPDGQRIGLIKLPEICSNVCFGGTRRNQLFMTASQSLYVVPVETRGAHFC